jgi:hypothetical protein
VKNIKAEAGKLLQTHKTEVEKVYDLFKEKKVRNTNQFPLGLAIF